MVGVVHLPECVTVSLDTSKLAFTAQEVGDLLGYDRQWVYGQINSGRLRAVKPSGNWRILRKDLDEFLDGLESNTDVA